MRIGEHIKSKFKNVEIITGEDNQVEVLFNNCQCSVLVNIDPERHTYSASYPELVRDGRGGWKTEERYSDNMLIDGLFWILKQVEKHGKVKPEIED